MKITIELEEVFAARLKRMLGMLEIPESEIEEIVLGHVVDTLILSGKIETLVMDRAYPDRAAAVRVCARVRNHLPSQGPLTLSYRKSGEVKDEHFDELPARGRLAFAG
ncbi:MAG: hypothetical protein V4671_34085 [Armatimonadota bacterium]